MSVVVLSVSAIAMIWVAILHHEITVMQSDIHTMNAIIKRLQAKHGMRADGIDKVR